MLGVTDRVRYGLTTRTLSLGLAVGLATAAAVAAGGGKWLLGGLVGVMVVAVTSSRPDLAIGTMIVGLPLVGNVTLLAIPGPDVTMGRLLILWSLAVVASAAVLQRRRGLRATGEDATDRLLSSTLPAWVAVLLALTLLAGIRGPTLIAGLQGWLDDYLLPFACLLIACTYRWSRRETDRIVTIYLACACVWSALAAYEFVTKRSLFTATGELPWASSGVPFGRTGGPFINPGFLGAALGIALVLALVWTGRRGPMRLLAVACLCMTVMGLVATLTRASWLGAVCGMLVVLSSSKRKRAMRMLLVALGLGACVVGLVMLFGVSYFEGRTTSQSEVFNRLVVQRAALKIIADHPLAGVGSGNFATVSRADLQNVGSISASYGVGVLAPHNSVLDATVSGGIATGASLVIAIGLLAAGARRRLISPAHHYLGGGALASVAVLTVNAMFMDMALAAQVTTMSLAVVGILLSTAPENEAGFQ